MSTTVETTLDTFHDDTHDGFDYPISKYDSVVGYYNGHKFKVTYEPPEYKEDIPYYGSYRLDVLESRPMKEWNQGYGGTVFYSERHTKPEQGFYTLFRRARKIAIRLCRDEFYKCPYCGFLATQDNTLEKQVPRYTRSRIKRAISTKNDPHEHTCAGLKTWWPPVFQVITHKKDENPLYSNKKLRNIETLVLAPGYPEHRYKPNLNHFDVHRLRSFIKDNPHVFKDELDVDTIKAVLDYADHTKSHHKTRLTDRYKLTRNEDAE